jgi:cell division protein FtsN
MAREAAMGDDAHELRLEGFKLVLAGGVLIALLIGAFQLGRAVERRTAPPSSTGNGGAATGGGDAPPEEVTEKLTFFDTLGAPGQEAEPKREATSASPRPATTAPPVASGAGPWFVQVFVGRDRAAAEEVVRTLRGKGYPVRAEAVREGATTSLFKVRVGGFPTREAADAAADRLHRDGQPSTWVVKTGA